MKVVQNFVLTLSQNFAIIRIKRYIFFLVVILEFEKRIKSEFLSK